MLIKHIPQKKVKIVSPVEADAAGEQLVELLHPAATAATRPRPGPPPAGLTSPLFLKKVRESTPEDYTLG